MVLSISLIIIIITTGISIFAFNNKNLRYSLSFSPYSYKHHKKWWLVITHGFIHADYIHLFFNMYVLYIFGQVVESYFITSSNLGFMYYISLYLGGLIFACVPSLIKHNDNPNYLSLGASGAVSAMVFTFILIDPLAKLGLIILPGVSLPGFIFGVLYLIAENYMSKKGKTNIAHDAHIAGAVFGIVFIGCYDYHVYINFFNNIANYIGIS